LTILVSAQEAGTTEIEFFARSRVSSLGIKQATSGKVEKELSERTSSFRAAMVFILGRALIWFFERVSILRASIPVMQSGIVFTLLSSRRRTVSLVALQRLAISAMVLC